MAKIAKAVQCHSELSGPCHCNCHPTQGLPAVSTQNIYMARLTKRWFKPQCPRSLRHCPAHEILVPGSDFWKSMIRKQVDLQLTRWCRLLSGDIEPRQGIITRAPACPWGRGARLLHHPPPLQYLSIQHVLHTLPPSILCQAVLLQHVQLYFHT